MGESGVAHNVGKIAELGCSQVIGALTPASYFK